MKGVSIKYGDYALQGKENFVPTTTDKASFVDLTELQRDDLRVGNYANPCELYQTILDGKQAVLPDDLEEADMGYWSESVTNDQKTFKNPIVMTLIAEQGFYTSSGITLTFDAENNVFCNNLNIHWYRIIDGQEIDLGDANYTPDSALYFCERAVANYNKVVITFYGLNMPQNRLKIASIDYGYGTIFTKDDLSNINVIQEIDRLSQNISINVVDFAISSRKKTNYSFQKKQPIEVYFNDDLVQACFVDTSTRTAEREWTITTMDYIGLLDNAEFLGDIYVDKNAVELLQEIFTKANVPYEIDANFNNEVVSGHIPIGTCRDALKQVCFAIGAVVDTSNSLNVKVMPLPNNQPEKLSNHRVFKDQRFTSNQIVKGVEVTSHRFKRATLERRELYNADTSGTGTNIMVKFSNPHIDFNIENGTILESNANYARINANENCVLSGSEYRDLKTVKTKTNPLIADDETDKMVRFNNYTLVSPSNIDRVLDRCYNESIKTDKISAHIVESSHRLRYGEGVYGERVYGDWIYDKPIKLGENLILPTEYLGDLECKPISMRYNLEGNMIVKECELV